MRERAAKTPIGSRIVAVPSVPSEVTALLLAWEGGDEAALERLMPVVHDELRRIARRCMARERSNHSLQATALVNEAYIRLVDAKQVAWRDRAHFMAIAARIMRRILVDHARSRGYQKRGGAAVRVTMTDGLAVANEPAHDVLAIHDALQALATLDARRSQVVELRFFGGLSVEETAAVLHVSDKTVMRDWQLAKAWLRRELRHEHAPDA